MIAFYYVRINFVILYLHLFETLHVLFPHLVVGIPHRLVGISNSHKSMWEWKKLWEFPQVDVGKVLIYVFIQNFFEIPRILELEE